MRGVTTWIVVADAGRARVLQNDGPGKGVKEVPGTDMVGPHRRDRDIMADRPGRSFDSAGHGRHAMEPPTDPKRAEQHAFFADVAERLEAAAREGRFDRLVLVAEPRALGELRHLLAPAVAAKVSAELDKDLTHLSAAEIGERLGGVLAV